MKAMTKKSLLMGLGIFAVLVLVVGVVYFVRRPAVTKPTPTPTPQTALLPTTAPVFEVNPADAKCSTTLVVPCPSPSPSPSPSGSPTPTPSHSPSPSPSPSPLRSPSPVPSVSAGVSPSPTPSIPGSAALDCVAKEVYQDDTRNRAGFYYLETKIADASTLSTGTTVTYNVIAKNSGSASASDVKITDVLSTNLSFVDADSDCSYDSGTRTLTCTVGTLNANAQTQRSFRATINSAGTSSIANSAEVFSSNGQRDICSVNLNTVGQVIVTQASEAPAALPQAGVFEITAGTMGVGLLLLILGALGLLLI